MCTYVEPDTHLSEDRVISQTMIPPVFLFLISYLFDASITGMGIVVNLHAQDLRATSYQLGLIGFAWGSAYCAGSLVSGRIIDLVPRRVLCTVGISFFVIAALLNGLARHAPHLIQIALLTGWGCALFWPAFETLLHVRDDDVLTARNMGVFNIGWTLGIACGTGSGGFLHERWGAITGFHLYAGLASLTVLLFLGASRNGIPRSTHAQDLTNQILRNEGGLSRREIGFLWIAWIGNLAMWFTGSAAGALFPKLARSLEIPDGNIGLLLASITAAQCLTFYALARSRRWHYRMAPILLLQVATVVGLCFVIRGNAPATFAVAMALIGIGRGVTYSSSLFYGLRATQGGGSSTGVHEFLVGLGLMLGPLVSGLAAQHISLRAPFAVCVGIVAVGMIAQWWVWKVCIEAQESRKSPPLTSCLR